MLFDFRHVKCTYRGFKNTSQANKKKFKLSSLENGIFLMIVTGNIRKYVRKIFKNRHGARGRLDGQPSCI